MGVLCSQPFALCGKDHMNQKGQSTVEYILLVTAVIAVVIFLTAGNKSLFFNKMSNTANITMTGMEAEAQRLTNAITNR
jgi:hypothetical protein